jgi:hypothetical protein
MTENPYAGQGSVLLDIGGEVGALVVTMPPGMVGVEVEIRPEGHEQGHDHAHGHTHGHTHHPHVAVVPRPVGDGHVASLVYPEVVEGRYHLAITGTSTPVLAVQVRGGEVATADWPL